MKKLLALVLALVMLLGVAAVGEESVLDKDPFLASPVNEPLVKELKKDKYMVKDYSRIS